MEDSNVFLSRFWDVTILLLFGKGVGALEVRHIRLELVDNG